MDAGGKKIGKSWEKKPRMIFAPVLEKQEKIPGFHGIQPLATPWGGGVEKRDKRSQIIPGIAPMDTTGIRIFPKLGFFQKFPLREFGNFGKCSTPNFYPEASALPWDAQFQRGKKFPILVENREKKFPILVERETPTSQNSMEWESQLRIWKGFPKVEKVGLWNSRNIHCRNYGMRPGFIHRGGRS